MSVPTIVWADEMATVSDQAAPLRAVDLVAIDDEGVLHATTRIDAATPYLRGHYPDRPIQPGVFVLESLIQAATHAYPRYTVVGVDSLRLTTPLLPGDCLRLTARLADSDSPEPRLTAQGVKAAGIDAARLRIRLRRNGTDGTSENDGRSGNVGPAEGSASSATSVTSEAPSDLPAPADPAPGLCRTGSILARLPHRPPILLVDDVVAVEPGHSITTLKAVTTAEPCFAHVAPELPRVRYGYPRSLLLESFVQSGALLWLLSVPTGSAPTGSQSTRSRPTGRPDGVPMLVGVRDVRYHRHVFPGEVLIHQVTVTRAVDGAVVFGGRTRSGGRLVAEYGQVTAAVRPMPAR